MCTPTLTHTYTNTHFTGVKNTFRLQFRGALWNFLQISEFRKKIWKLHKYYFTNERLFFPLSQSLYASREKKLWSQHFRAFVLILLVSWHSVAKHTIINLHTLIRIYLKAQRRYIVKALMPHAPEALLGFILEPIFHFYSDVCSVYMFKLHENYTQWTVSSII